MVFLYFINKYLIVVEIIFRVFIGLFMWLNIIKFLLYRYKLIGYKLIYVLLIEDKNEDYEIF